MKRGHLNLFPSQFSPQRWIQISIGVGFLYMFLVTLEEPFVFNIGFNAAIHEGYNGFNVANSDRIQKSAKEAFELGKKLWEELEDGEETEKNQTGSCPNSVSLSGSEFSEQGQILVLPCGLRLGSRITLVGRPRITGPEHDPKTSQFMMELQGLKTVNGGDPPRILQFNPRLKGDWSGKPVIVQKTCYRKTLRCEGWQSKADEQTVDGGVKCEKWIRDEENRNESRSLNQLIGGTKNASGDWSYPFAKGKQFVLTLVAGLEGYHFNVDGRHVTSLPYRTKFILEHAAARLSLNGDVDVYSITAASLSASPPSAASHRLLEMSCGWQAPPISDGPVELFIGILSTGNHFAERMAVRRSWMQHRLIDSSSNVVAARFFLALHARKEVNMELKKEAELFGDIVIVPYMDNYDLVVLKTVAICEYGVRTVSAKYIMKCDDDTFVRLDAVMKEIKKVPDGKSFYMGSINFQFKPFRHGKWAVTYEEWPDAFFPPFANGPGYVVSSDIARFVVSEYENKQLKLFRMEDTSMGMWVKQYNCSSLVEYIHSSNFFPFGCIEDYYTAHYQSPKQMICLWNKLQRQERPQCCNMR